MRRITSSLKMGGDCRLLTERYEKADMIWS